MTLTFTLVGCDYSNESRSTGFEALENQIATHQDYSVDEFNRLYRNKYLDLVSEAEVFFMARKSDKEKEFDNLLFELGYKYTESLELFKSCPKSQQCPITQKELSAINTQMADLEKEKEAVLGSVDKSKNKRLNFLREDYKKKLMAEANRLGVSVE